VATQAAFLFVRPPSFSGSFGAQSKVPEPRDRTLSAYFEFRFFDFCFNQQRKCWTDIRFIGGLLILYGYASGYAAQLQWLARLFTA
jgi:hypothetical protein